MSTGRVVFALTLSLSAFACSDDAEAPDPCEGITCSDHGTCEVQSDVAVCDCDEGYEADDAACTPIEVPDPCADDDCDVNATCTPDGTDFTCACNTGFEGDGKSCTAIVPPDPCLTDDCDVNATCTPTADGTDFTCACNENFEGDGKSCAPIEPPDPCLDNDCDVNATCTPTADDADFTCACNTGFEGDGTTCTPIPPPDPCVDNDCDVNATCTPTADNADYTCACDEGFEGDGLACIAVAIECDPEATTDTCGYGCLPDGDSGFCVDVCAGDGDCPAGWRCDAERAPEGEAGLCLPNASCGDLTFFGACDGTTLSYCSNFGPAEIECPNGNDATGQPLVCALASPEIGYDCISSVFTGGCGTVTYGGGCDGDVLTYCESQESGEVVSVDCAADGYVCVESDGSADCVEDGATGCGKVLAHGSCEGNVATWCEDFEVKTQDCAATDEVCGRAGDDLRCVTPLPAGGSASVAGTMLYEKLALTVDGLGDASSEPVRGALVTVRTVADNTRLAEGYTDDEGSYELTFEADEDVYVLLTAQGEPGVHNHVVRDCPLDDCEDGLGTVYGIATETFTPAAATDLGAMTIALADNAGAFNIHELFVRASDFAAENFGRRPPMVTVHWAAGSGTAGGTSYFSGATSSVYVLGGPDDTDEYDDPVLLHEYGHYLEFYLSHSDNPGGSHDGSPADPRLAWGEGFGTYFGAAVAGGPLYIDTSAGGASVTDVRIAGNDFPASPNDPRGMKQLLSEQLVTQILYTIALGPDDVDGKTHAPSFDVIGNYLTSFASPAGGRGVQGVDLVDFLDGWFCKQYGDRPYIEAIVNDTAGFPYDYAGPASCE